MARRRVVVTGLGIVAPVGIGLAQSWNNIVAGKSGIGRITRFDASAFSSQIAGEVKDFDVSRYLPAKEARRMDTFIHYGMAAGIDAIKDAGLETYADVPASDPRHDSIEAKTAAGITAGCGDGKFCPDAPVTRGQLAVFLAKALGLHFAQ